MCIVCQHKRVSGQVYVLSVSIRQFLDRYVYCLTISGQVCNLSASFRQFLDKVWVLSFKIRQFLDRYEYCLSVSDSFWTGMCIVC